MQDYKDGSYSQVTASTMDNKWREDFERMKKARVHRCAAHPAGYPMKDSCDSCSGCRTQSTAPFKTSAVCYLAQVQAAWVTGIPGMLLLALA